MTTNRSRSWNCVRTWIGSVLVAVACGGDRPVDLARLREMEPPQEHRAGAALFAAHCQACHGISATGSPQGPPLVDWVYEPSHHGDAAFLLAAQRGVRAHHWRFGDMPAVRGVTESDVGEITGYVRWLQRQAGIE
jgi:mono/diheme cytochrome c family protein